MPRNECQAPKQQPVPPADSSSRGACQVEADGKQDKADIRSGLDMGGLEIQKMVYRNT